jgi:hypothetical protein
MGMFVRGRFWLQLFCAVMSLAARHILCGPACICLWLWCPRGPLPPQTLAMEDCKKSHCLPLVYWPAAPSCCAEVRCLCSCARVLPPLQSHSGCQPLVTVACRTLRPCSAVLGLRFNLTMPALPPNLHAVLGLDPAAFMATYSLLSLHMWLIIHRLKLENRADVETFQQALYTHYFYRDVERRIYRAGVTVRRGGLGMVWCARQVVPGGCLRRPGFRVQRRRA